jgi:serine/threonine protein kinase
LEKKVHIPFDRKVELTLLAFRALRDLHRHSIVHRDIKPGNIIVVIEFDFVDFKLIDFGLSKRISLAGSRATPHVTLSAGMGTPGYQPLESFNNDGKNPATALRGDWFSMGITLYQLWYGRHPFTLDPGGLKSNGWEELLKKRKSRRTEIPEKAGGEKLPGPIREFLCAALQIPVENRNLDLDLIIGSLSTQS